MARMDCIHRFMRADSGATAIEYSLIAGLIALVIVGGLRSVGAALGPRYQNLANAVPS